MPKRKLIFLGRRSLNHTQNNETTSESSDSIDFSPKRFRQYISSENSDDKEQLDSDNEPENPSSSSEEDESDNEVAEPLHSTKIDASCQNNDENLMDSSQYDGYQSFMSSFQMFSEDESSDTDSQATLKCIKTERNRIIAEVSLMQSQPCDTIVTKDQIVLQKISENVQIFGHYLNSLEIVVMEHSSSVPLVGYLAVTLIAGKASIQGYELKKNVPVKVFSQKQTGILSITSQSCSEDEMFDVKCKLRCAFRKLFGHISKEERKEYMKRSMKYPCAAFIIRYCGLPPALDFLGFYSSFAVSFEKRNRDAQKILVKTKYTVSNYAGFTGNNKNLLQFGAEYKKIFFTIYMHLLNINKSDIKEEVFDIKKEVFDIKKEVFEEEMEVMENSSSSEDDFEDQLKGFRILISGPRKSGKSTMLRYLMNCFLNKYPEVYYLDTDPGQTEFTPPGAISLVKVTNPVFGPPYSHLRKPENMIYTGSITAETSPSMHMKSITNMISYFNKHYPNSILLVNTMGWLTGIGDMILQHIRKKLKPDVEIKLDPGLTPLNISVEGGVLSCHVGFERDAATSTKQGDNRPADLRDWTVLAYLGQCQKFHLQPDNLNAIRPMSVCWDKIAIYNFNKRLNHNRYYEALNGSVVALCNVAKSLILAPTNPEYPMTVEDEPHNECIGFGFVRAVDEEKHMIYMDTPVDTIVLYNKVNALLCGNILIPRSVVFSQWIGMELDYTDESREGKTELRKAIRKRSRGHSSNTRF